MKRGQITLFVILGVVIIISVLIMFSLSDELRQEKSVPTVSANLEFFINSCIEDILINGIKLSANQGGAIYVPSYPESILGFSNSILYGYYEGVVLLNSITELETELNVYMEEKLPVCINSWVGGILQVKTPQSNIQILRDEVVARVNYPITQIDSGRKFENFYVSKDYKLGLNLAVAHAIANNQILNPQFIDLEYLELLPLNVDILRPKAGSLIFVISGPGLNDLKFNLGLKHKLNNPPLVLPIPTLRVKVGETLTYNIPVVDFEDNNFDIKSTGSIPVSNNGLIQFTPSANHIGIHEIQFIVTDEENNNVYGLVMVEVIA